MEATMTSDFDSDGDVNGSLIEQFTFPVSTTNTIQNMIPHVLNKSWDNLSITLSEWQKSQLEDLEETGVRCLLDMWLINQKDLELGTYCNATWDNVYCWPPTPTGNTVSRPCSEILQDTEPSLAHEIKGKAIRVCTGNGTWLWGNWTNYTECADSYDDFVRNTEEERTLVVAVQYIIFIGSVLSIVCLAMALLIFFYFKCLRCDRVTVHTHLMIALMLRSASLIIITEPFVFNRTKHYRNVDLLCKAVLSLNLYSTVTSVNWMFIQGVYLHGKLTTNVFDRGTPFRIYHLIGWVLPLFLVIGYATVLETYHPVHCWRDYSERNEIWILLGPMIFALLANLLFLINIMRILLTKVQRPNSTSDSAQLRRAVKATFVLFPLLGINNLLFLYDPGGEYHKYFVLFNAILGSTQGIFVSILYCFVSKDVRAAIHRLYRRYTIRRTANSMRISHSRGSSVMHHSTIRSRPRIHFRTKLKRITQTQSEELSGVRVSCSTSPELVMVHEVRGSCSRDFGSGSSSPPSPFGNNGRESNGIIHNNPLLLQDQRGARVKPFNRYSVALPLDELK
ncbi:unnamed protein product [Orchesella dallaii]|uniref:Uncharacterized protein n=1 Tax=Orchesella dallaii TaxID=48710 RepID=A0ABP1RZP3_9HEXA